MKLAFGALPTLNMPKKSVEVPKLPPRKAPVRVYANIYALLITLIINCYAISFTETH